MAVKAEIIWYNVKERQPEDHEAVMVGRLTSKKKDVTSTLVFAQYDKNWNTFYVKHSDHTECFQAEWWAKQPEIPLPTQGVPSEKK